MNQKTNISILGDGAWGTALALVLASSGHRVAIWGHDPAYLAEMRRERRNRLFLPYHPLPESIEFIDDMAKAIERAELVVSAIPSKFLRATLSKADRRIGNGKTVASLTKGLDAATLERPSEVVRECLGAERIAALSGPSHAEEVARFLPASLVAASDDLGTARAVQAIVSTPRFRVYASRDIIGVEMAGTMKNVIALAAGICHGLKLGDNALSALATRGLAEMMRLGVAVGGEAATFAGLAGMGDLITTCVSEHGRNRHVGILLAEGKTLEDILAGMNGVPESVTTTRSVLALARKHGVECPIAEQVAAVIWDGKSPEEAVNDLMTRARKDERE